MTTKTQKGKRERTEPVQARKIRYYQQKKDYFTYEMFYTNLMMKRKYKSREETRNINKKLRKTSEKTTKQKWQTETQGKRNNGDLDKQKTKIKEQY